MRGAWLSAVVGLFVLAGLAGSGSAQTAPAAGAPPSSAQAPVKPEDAVAAQKSSEAEALKNYSGPEYVRSEAMISVRDGVKLHTVILRPAGSDRRGAKLPFLMERTPYGVDGTSAASVKLGKTELATSGYIFVYQDIRGRYGSGGHFVMNRPVVEHSSKQDVDETTDARDTVAWLLKHVPNNSGKVGVLGVSYPGFLAIMAGIDADPAVKAISPQAPMTDVWMGDDFFHNGAFRETYGFDYVQGLEAQKTNPWTSSRQDQYTFFLDHGNFAGAAAAAGMTHLPTASRFLSEPAYTKFWQDMAVERRLTKPEVPTLEVGGYWDQEDMWGTQAEYAALRVNEKPNDSLHKVFLVLGPWNHGGWSHGAGDELGGKFGTVTFDGQKTGEYYRANLEAPFFEFYLKRKPGFDLQDTASFRTGANQWHRYPAWPPKVGFHQVRAYLVPGGAEPQGKLSFTAPAGQYNVTAAAYLSDPADPVPYRHRPIQSTYGENSTWRTWLAEDQRFVSGRKDLANFETPVLAGDVTVTGDVAADIFGATTGTDADWIVKLIDVYPKDAPGVTTEDAAVSGGGGGGYELMVGEEIFRGRYRKSFMTPEPVKTGEVVEYKWSLHGVDHTFLKGHRMMVEVQSTWFPLYDRNPQTYVENIMTAPPSAYQAETVSIYGAANYPSHLDLPVADGAVLP